MRRYFGYEEAARTALDAVLAFTPATPSWAYNGAALGIGDFSNNAKWTPYGGWERPLTHYRAGEACKLHHRSDNCHIPGEGLLVIGLQIPSRPFTSR